MFVIDNAFPNRIMIFSLILISISSVIITTNRFIPEPPVYYLFIGMLLIFIGAMTFFITFRIFFYRAYFKTNPKEADLKSNSVYFVEKNNCYQYCKDKFLVIAGSFFIILTVPL